MAEAWLQLILMVLFSVAFIFMNISQALTTRIKSKLSSGC
jgi:hypothetical protein